MLHESVPTFSSEVRHLNCHYLAKVFGLAYVEGKAYLDKKKEHVVNWEGLNPHMHWLCSEMHTVRWQVRVHWCFPEDLRDDKDASSVNIYSGILAGSGKCI